MIAKLAASARHLLGHDPAGRNLRTFPDDTFIVSYPKSGNTWTRFLVASLIHNQEPMTFLKADKVIPSIDTQSRRYFKSLPRPRVIKSHFPFDPTYKRVIYIVRDPKDVAVSQYHYQIKRKVLQDGHPIDEWIGSIAQVPVGSLVVVVVDIASSYRVEKYYLWEGTLART